MIGFYIFNICYFWLLFSSDTEVRIFFLIGYSCRLQVHLILEAVILVAFFVFIFNFFVCLKEMFVFSHTHTPLIHLPPLTLHLSRSPSTALITTARVKF